MEPPGPAFGWPDDKLRDTRQCPVCNDDGFREELNPSSELPAKNLHLVTKMTTRIIHPATAQSAV